MAQAQNFGAESWKILVVAGMFLYLTGCSLIPRPEPEIKVVTKVEKTEVPIMSRPKPVQLSDTRVRVINEQNLEQFIKEFKEQYGEVAIVVLSMRDYENLALNIADIRRYINQQKEIIIYYEKAVAPQDKNTTESSVQE
tara:strand:+ start:20 stop:436 length:417 start_codon:yes stop_codon:yes gene_type:complete